MFLNHVSFIHLFIDVFFISFIRLYIFWFIAILILGAKECVEQAKARILEIVKDLEAMITIEVVIPQEYHRAIMGAKGSNVQEITTRWVDVPY